MVYDAPMFFQCSDDSDLHAGSRCGFKMPISLAPIQEIRRWTVCLTPEIDTNAFEAIWQR